MSSEEIPQKQRLISSVYYEVGSKWVDLDAAARILEETKTALLSQRKLEVEAQGGKMSKAQAEDLVRASPEWRDHLHKIVNARTAANRERLKLETLRMRHAEQQSKEATARHEARLDR
jgi:hypothetical protein